MTRYGGTHTSVSATTFPVLLALHDDRRVITMLRTAIKSCKSGHVLVVDYDFTGLLLVVARAVLA